MNTMIAFNTTAASFSCISLHIHTSIVLQNLEHKCHLFVIIDSIYTVHKPTINSMQTFDFMYHSCPLLPPLIFTTPGHATVKDCQLLSGSNHMTSPCPYTYIHTCTEMRGIFTTVCFSKMESSILLYLAISLKILWKSLQLKWYRFILWHYTPPNTCIQFK